MRLQSIEFYKLKSCLFIQVYELKFVLSQFSTLHFFEKKESMWNVCNQREVNHRKLKKQWNFQSI